MEKLTRTAWVLAAILALPAATVALAEASTCDARADAELMTQQPRGGGGEHLSFKVDVRLEGQCGEVHYALILRVNPGGETEEVRIERQVNLHDSNTSQKVDHTLPEGHSLVDYRAEVERCVPCDPE